MAVNIEEMREIFLKIFSAVNSHTIFQPCAYAMNAVVLTIYGFFKITDVIGNRGIEQ